MPSVRLKGRTPTSRERYPLGDIPEEIVRKIGRLIIYWLSTGLEDISGDLFADIFASAADGEHLKSPEGLVDVCWKQCGWSVKTVQHKDPLDAVGKSVRIIAGRNSPKFSKDIDNPMADPQETGKAVLEIWNERVKQSKARYSTTRRIVMLRNMQKLQFALYETELVQFSIRNYQWKFNRRSNLEGFEKASPSNHVFTWQPHGAQFTIIDDPGALVKFEVTKRPNPLGVDEVLRAQGFDENWVRVLPTNGK